MSEPTRTRYVNAFSTDNGKVYAIRRDEGGRVVVSERRAEFVFFVRAAIEGDVARTIRGNRHCIGFANEGEWTRVRWDRREVAIKAAEWLAENKSIDACEADVPPVRRWITDHEIEIAQPRRVYLDLETDSRVPFSRKEEARILMYSLVDGATGASKARVLEADTDAAERDLLATLWAELEAWDQVVAWNGDRFDFEMLAARTAHLRIKVERRRWLWLDHLVLFRRMNASAAESGEEKQSMALEAVARSVLGEGKLEGVTGASSWALWSGGEEGRALLVRYCVRDSDLMRRIEERTGYIDLLQTLCEATHTFPDTHGINPTTQVEGFMLRLAKGRGVHFPTHFRRAVVEQYRGAFVMEPSYKGILRHVHVGDFASLYPSIILTWNMSLETHRPDVILRERAEGRPVYLSHLPLQEFPRPEGTCEVPITEAVFANEPRGILAEALETMIGLRKAWNERKANLPPGTEEWKDADRRATAYKIAANSFYGVVGSPFSRFFQREVAESVSQGGVWLIGKTIDAAKDEGMRVVYGDTDSIFVAGLDGSLPGSTGYAAFGDFVKRCNAELYPRILASKGCARNHIKLAYEKAFDRIVFVTAKRYVGRYSHFKGTVATADSKPEVKGLEYKRGDVAKLARELQAEVVALLMAGDDPPGPEVFVPVLDRWKTHVLDGELAIGDVMLAKRLSKPLKEYARRTKQDGSFAAEPPHVAVARVLKERGADVGEGVKIEYFVVDGEESPMKVLPAADFAGIFDRFYLWESLVYLPTQRLLEAAFPAFNWKPWERVRPPKVRARSQATKAATRCKVPKGQGSLF
jgi:DNA polymerase I